MEDNNTDDNASKMVMQLASSTSWVDIPDELWQKILHAVLLNCNQHLLDSVSLVCKRFLTLSNHFVTSVSLSPSKSSQPPYSRFSFIDTIELSRADTKLDATITQLAHSNLHLQSLILSSQTHFPMEAMRLLGQRMGRTLTSLSCVWFDNLGDGDVDIVADYFPYLQKLDIGGNNEDGGQVTDKGILAISSKLKFLLSLSVTNHEHLSHRSFEYLSSNSLLLSELTAGSCNKFAIGLDQFISFSSLTSLNLDFVNISETILGKLSEAKLKLRMLYLFLPECSNDIKGTTICRFFKSLASLRCLFLKGFRFTADMTARDFALSIPNMEALILHHSDIPQRTSECILFQVLKNCRLLKGILISFGSLGPPQDWLNVPLRCKLENLELFRCPDLDDQIMECICSICPNLETLDINHCEKITQKGVEAVRAGCGNLRFLSVFGCDLPYIKWEKSNGESMS